MTTEKYYTSGQFARMANVSIRTIRFYDKQNILKPSYVKPSGSRCYTDGDFARLQQILLFKYLGFTLEDIREMTINDTDSNFMVNSLKIQKKLVADRIEQLQQVETSLGDITDALEDGNHVDWSQMLHLIHLTDMENNLKGQYKNATNISARISLHRDYSINQQGWFPWIYEEAGIQSGMRILEIGCGNGALWTENFNRLPDKCDIVLSDISDGMIRDVRRNLETLDTSASFEYEVFDCHNIPFADNTFDIVIANHVLFYCDDIPKVCSEIRRVLKGSGHFLCSTYGNRHMREISELVKEFDNHITLSADALYERFGLDNGRELLSNSFDTIELVRYEDAIELDRPEPLIEYILSCHGNQNQYLLDKYQDFRTFVTKKVGNGYHITKDAGIFICR